MLDWDEWGDGDIQSDALLDLRTQDNALSVFRVDEGAGIGRIVTALAATRENLSHLDYVVFDDAPTSVLMASVLSRGTARLRIVRSTTYTMMWSI